MIIAKSKVNLSSNRAYSQYSTKDSYTSRHTGMMPISQTFGTRLTNKYVVNESYKNSEDTNSYYSQVENRQSSDSMMYGVFSYAKKGVLLNAYGNVLNDQNINTNQTDKNPKASNDKEITDNANSEVTNQTTEEETLLNLRNTYNEVSNRLFSTLMNIFKRLRFRSGFEDSYSYKNYQKNFNNNNFNNNNSLVLTNSFSPSVLTVEHGYSSFYEETECTTFRGEGMVVTADGREISFGLNVEMSRSFTEYNELSYVESYPQILTDPLVINLDSNPTTVSDQTFFFDLDCDGKKEEIARLNSGSGYLALDKNNDGVINDGSELFGTKTGNGFKELAAYDSDGNGWIDEADDIYNKLKVWVRDENGKERLLSLKEADVGAIYLGSSKTEFSLKNDDQKLVGQVRSTGMYLHENGEAGSVQQVDF